MIVMKFGGSSLKDNERMEQVAEIIKRERKREPVTVVVSAMGSVTDRLLEIVHLAENQDEHYRELINDLEAYHMKVIEQGIERNTEKVTEEISEEFDRLLEVCKSISVLGELTPRTRDLASSRGERLAAKIIAAKLEEIGVTAGPVMATDLVITDERFGSANPLLDPTKNAVQENLSGLYDRGITPVITGYIGATEEGIPTTLGRGGSDYTATLIANLVDASEVIIWTDVDGVKAADPAVVAESETISRLTYEEAAELSYFGAQVIHPKAIDKKKKKGIPIRIKNTYNPGGQETKISNGREAFSGLKSVTSISDLSLITVQGHGMIGVPGIAATVFSAVAEIDVNVFMISQSSSEQNITFLVRASEAKRAVNGLRSKLQTELNYENVEGINTEGPVAVIAAVGSGLRHQPGIDAQVFTSLSKRGINVLSIAQGSSDHNISLVVKAEEVEKTIHAIHEEITSTNSKQPSLS